MEQYPFIFSNKLKHRLLRHFTFWFCWWLFSTFLYSYIVAYQFLPSLERIPISATESFIFLINHLFISYTLMYMVVPHLLIKGRYFASFYSVILLVIATGLINGIISTYYLEYWRNCILNTVFGLAASPNARPQSLNFYLSLLAGLRGGLTVGGIAAPLN